MVYPGREEHLKYLLAGLQKTGIPLVEFDGTQFLPAGMEDDIGMYVLIPKLTLLLNIPLSQAITLFFNVMSYGAAGIGMLGFMHYFTTWPSRIMSILGVCALTIATTTTTDVYRAPAAIVIATIPWALYYLQKQTSLSRYLFLTCAGFACMIAHFIRGHSGSTPAIFMVLLIIVNSYDSWRSKVISIFALVCGALPAYFYFHSCLTKYHTFIQEKLPEYAWVQVQHTFWHTIYAGMGFISNDLGLSFDDGAPHRRVEQVAPQAIRPALDPWKVPLHVSAEYETVLRNETIALIKRHTFYVVRVLVAKLGLLLFYLLLFAHVGLWCAWRRVINSSLTIAFTAALSWSALPGILAIPNFLYLTGFISLAGMLGILGTGILIAQQGGYLKQHVARLRNSF